MLRGDFTFVIPTPPHPMPPQKTKVITLVVTRDTLRGLDYGFGNETLDTSKIGPGLELNVG